MNFKSLAYQLLLKIDEKPIWLIPISRKFIAFALFFAANNLSQEFKKDVSWLLWIILYKNNKAGSCSDIIKSLIFLGADLNFKLLPGLPSTNELLTKSSQPLRNGLQMPDCAQISVEMPNYTLVKSKSSVCIVESLESGIFLRAENKHNMVILNLQIPEVANCLVTNFLMLGYMSGIEYLYRNNNIPRSSLNSIACFEGANLNGINASFIADETAAARSLTYLAEHLLPNNKSEREQFYEYLNCKLSNEISKIGIDYITVIKVINSGTFQIYKALLCGHFDLDLTSLAKGSNLKNLTQMLGSFLLNITFFSPEAAYALEAFHYLKKIYPQEYEAAVSIFWCSLCLEVIKLNSKNKIRVTKILSDIIKENFYIANDIINLVITVSYAGRNDIFDVVLSSLSDSEFVTIFEDNPEIYHKLMSHELSLQQISLLMKRCEMLRSREPANPVLSCSKLLTFLGGKCIESQRLDILERALKCGLDPYESSQDAKLPSVIFCIIKNNFLPYNDLKVVLKFKPFNILLQIENFSIAAEPPIRVSPITLDTDARLRGDLISRLEQDSAAKSQKIKEGLKSAYFSYLRGEKQKDNFVALSDREESSTSISTMLIDSYLQTMANKERTAWFETNKQALIDVLLLKQNPQNYARLLGSLIQSRRHDLLSLFLNLGLDPDCEGIHIVTVMSNEIEKLHLKNLRALNYAIAHSDLQSLVLLRAAGAEFLWHDLDATPPLDWALQTRDSAVVEYVLDNILVTDNNKHHATRFVSYLKGIKFDPEIKNKKANFLAMLKRCELREVTTLVALAICDKDSLFLNEVMNHFCDLTIQETSDLIIELLFSVYTEKEHRIMSFEFFKMILARSASRISLYIIMIHLIQGLKDEKQYNQHMTKAVVDSFLYEFGKYVASLSLPQSTDLGLIELLQAINTARFIRLLREFMPLIKTVNSTQLIASLAVTAIRAKELPIAHELLDFGIDVQEHGNTLLLSALEVNAEGIITKLITLACENNVELLSSNFYSCLQRSIQNQNTSILTILCNYLVVNSHSSVNMIIELYKLRSYARDNGNIIAGEIISKAIDTLRSSVKNAVDVSNTIDAMSTTTGRSQFFTFKTPDSSLAATVSIEEEELAKLSKKSKAKLLTLFQEFSNGHSGLIKPIKKYRNFGVDYKIRFYDIQSNDRRGYLKKKPTSTDDNLQYEFFSAPKHK